MKKKLYKIKAKIWLYSGSMAAWHFVALPKKQSAEIKKAWGSGARGWGSLPVQITIGKTTWQTSIFPDKQSETYVLPLKASVRKAEGIYPDDTITFNLKLRV